MENRRTAKRPLPASGMKPSRRPCLTVHEGADLGREYFLKPGEAVIGRGADADVGILDPCVSHRHARLLVPEDSAAPLRFEDLGSRNGTLCNGRRRVRGEIREGDLLQVGDTVLRFGWKGRTSARYTRKLYRRATRDPLTDTLNRDQFSRRLEEAWVRTVGLGAACSLLMVDLDRFKEINDTHGHVAGDRVLQAVAGALQKAVRKPDVVARYGGEEFAVILADTGIDEALATAERVRAEIEALLVDGGGAGPIRVTVSVGIATVPPLLAAAPEELVRAADRALYAAKASGRNRCRAHPGSRV